MSDLRALIKKYIDLFVEKKEHTELERLGFRIATQVIKVTNVLNYEEDDGK